MTCRQCQHENPPEAKFCNVCGARLALRCAGCGQSNPAGSRFCNACGQGLAATPQRSPRFASPESYTPRHLAERILTSKSALEGERKLVTVLFADLKGSMELLADRDPEEARKILDPVLDLMMEAVHRYEGTVNQVMGDGIMALFGAPVAHEDHVVRACYAALRMQEAVKRYAADVRRTEGIAPEIRVGLNSGVVVVRAIGSDLHMDYTAVGQTTHLAARMEQAATAGSILVTAETLRLAEGYVVVKPLGAVSVKGLDKPVQAYELTGAAGVRTRLQASAARGLTTFVGRDAEMELLGRAHLQASQGRGQVVAVVGEPGVGKSRLFYEFIRSQRTHGSLVLASGSVSYGKATSYLPVIDMLKSYFAVHDDDTHRQIREKIAGKVLTLDRALEATLPALLSLLDIPVDDSQWQALGPPQRRQRTLEAVKRLLLSESHVQPLVLVLEDLHWVDSESEALLDGLVESLPTASILLLLNYRPEYHNKWTGKTYYQQARIDPFAGEDAEALLRSLLGPDASVARLTLRLLERTEGNPLFVEESVRALVETGMLGGEPGRYRFVGTMEGLQVPATVEAILAARIDRLPAEEKAVLQAAAVVGKDVPRGLLAAIADIADDALQRHLGALQAAEFLYQTQLFPDLEYTFKHALTHEVAYGGLLHERRRALHARVVETVEKSYANRILEQVERLAHHALRAESWRKAIGYLGQAGAKAASRSANVEAIDHLTRGLATVDRIADGPERLRLELDLQLALGPALMTTKGYGAPEVVRTYARARELCRHVGEHPELFTVLHGLWLYYWVRGDMPAVLDLAQQLHDLAQRVDDLALRMLAHELMGEVAAYRPDFPAARSHMERSLALYDPSQHRSLGFRYGGYDPAMAGRAIGAHALWCLGFPDQALAWSRSAVALARDLSHVTTLAFALGHAGILHYFRREPRLTREVAEEVLALSIGQSLEFWKAFAEILRGWALVRQQRGPEGIESMRDGLGRYRVTGGELESPIWLAMMADAYVAEKAPDEGLSAVATGLELVNAMDLRFAEAELYRLRGELLLMRGGAAAADAEGAFRRSLEVAAGQKARCLELRAAIGLARLWRQRGERELAERTLAPVYAWFTEGSTTDDLQVARTLLDELR
jgi:class 3 adenylate cyclase/predicted ATPase